MTYRYRLYGLRIRSDFPLPELLIDRRRAPADVTVTAGSLPPGPPGHHLQVEGETATLWVTDADATYQMEHGRTLTVDSRGRAIGRNVRLYLLGSAFAAILHQRGLLPLHACALECNGRGFAVLGRSGAGKSTLSAWLVDRGVRLLSDDVCVVRKAAPGFVAEPGIPRLRLWRETIEARGDDPQLHPLSFENWDKHDVPAASASMAAAAPLAALFLLEDGPNVAFEPLSGAAAIEALSVNTYRGSYVRQMNRTAEHLNQCVALVRSVPVERFSRPRDLSRMNEASSCLLERISQLLG